MKSKIEVKNGEIQAPKTWNPKVKDPRVGQFNGPRLIEVKLKNKEKKQL